MEVWKYEQRSLFPVNISQNLDVFVYILIILNYAIFGQQQIVIHKVNSKEQFLKIQIQTNHQNMMKDGWLPTNRIPRLIIRSYRNKQIFKMSKKLDLNNYLNKYLSSNEGRPVNLQDSRSKFSEPVQMPASRASRPPTQHEINYEEESRPVSRQTTAGFQKAQLECLEELHEVRRILAEEEKQINYFVGNYHKRVVENLHREHHRIREEVLEMFEKAFETNQRRIDEALAALNSNEPVEFLSIRKRIDQINHDISRLEQGLRSSNYRPVIAQVVTSDFDTVTRELQALVDSTQKLVYENSPKLHVNEQCFRRMKEDMLNIIVLDAHKEGKEKAEPPIPEPKKSTKNKLSLFDGKDSEKGSFFNFK